MASINSIWTNALLSAHQFQGISNDCGPYCAAIVLTVLGDKTEADTLAQQMNKPKWNNGFPVIRRIPNWATFPWGLVDIFKSRGFEANWKLFVSKVELMRLLGDGEYLIVFIGNLIPLWAHSLILISFDDNKGVGFVDPALELKEIHWISERNFINHWSVLGRTVLTIKHPDRN